MVVFLSELLASRCDSGLLAAGSHAARPVSFWLSTEEGSKNPAWLKQPLQFSGGGGEMWRGRGAEDEGWLLEWAWMAHNYAGASCGTGQRVVEP